MTFIKAIECECCGFLAIIPKKDSHDDLICPFCLKARCEHGGKFKKISIGYLFKVILNNYHAYISVEKILTKFMP